MCGSTRTRAPRRRSDAHDVGLEAVVHDRDERSPVARLVRRRDGHPADEVLVLPARQRAGPLDGRVRVRLAGGGDEAPLAAGLAQVTGQRPRVQAGDRGHALGAQQVDDLARPAEHRRGRVADHEATQPGSLGLVVTREPAVVADERIGHDHDLPGVRGVGADLLVAGLGGVDDQVAAGRHRRTEADALEHGAVLEGQQRRTVGADAWIDDGRRGHGHGHAHPARRTADERHGQPDTERPPAVARRWSWQDNVKGPPPCRPLWAASGLTGPVMQEMVGSLARRTVAQAGPPAARRPDPQRLCWIVRWSLCSRRRTALRRLTPAPGWYSQARTPPRAAPASNATDAKHHGRGDGRQHERRASGRSTDELAHVRQVPLDPLELPSQVARAGQVQPGELPAQVVRPGQVEVAQVVPERGQA